MGGSSWHPVPNRSRVCLAYQQDFLHLGNIWQRRGLFPCSWVPPTPASDTEQSLVWADAPSLRLHAQPGPRASGTPRLAPLTAQPQVPHGTLACAPHCLSTSFGLREIGARASRDTAFPLLLARIQAVPYPSSAPPARPASGSVLHLPAPSCNKTLQAC